MRKGPILYSGLVADDIDGAPIKEENTTEKPPSPPKAKFVASKWESVDEEVVKQQGEKSRP